MISMMVLLLLLTHAPSRLSCKICSLNAGPAAPAIELYTPTDSTAIVAVLMIIVMIVMMK